MFDVAQTDGEELPTVDVPTIDVAADKLLGDLTRVAEQRGLAVNFRPLSPLLALEIQSETWAA